MNIDREYPTNTDTFIRTLGPDIFGYSDLSGIPGLPFPDLRIGITLGIKLDPVAVLAITATESGTVYVNEYESVNERLLHLSEATASYIVGLGYSADFIPPTANYNDPRKLFAPFPHKTAATRAGLGWIGRSALLVTKDFGPAVRITTVFTDAPLKTGDPVEKSYCGRCTECLKACPAGAGTGKNWRPGISRDEIFDAVACLNYGRSLGERRICGICIAACPWTKRYLRHGGFLPE